MKRIRTTLWQTLSTLWLFAPCLALSTLLHVTDADVGSLRALASAEMLESIFVWSLPFVVGGWVSLTLLSDLGLRGFYKAILITSGTLGLFITLLGSSAVTPLGILWSVVGSSLVVLAFLVVGALPSLIITLRGVRTRV